MPPSISDVSGPPAPCLRLSLFGAPRLTTAEGAEIAISNRRARALLAMLSLSPGESMERDHVSRLLWPDRFPAQARASLRQCLLSLDKLLAPVAGPLLDVSRSRIGLVPSALGSDFADLETALAEGRGADVRTLVTAIGRQKLLDQPDFGEPYLEWLAATSRQAADRLQTAFDSGLAALEAAGDARGRALLHDAWRAWDPSPALRQDRRIRLAVLPFEQRDAIGGPLFLADGFVEELTVRLGGIPALALIGRTSVASVAGGGRTLPEIAAALGASHLIEGEVHRFADGIRVNLRLIDGASGTEIWSDRYDGTVDHAMQSRQILGSNVVAGLCKALGVDAAPRPARRMTTNRDAYALYLQGRALTLRVIGEGVLARGIEFLEQALEIDPEFAECWTALAEAQLYIATFNPVLDRPRRAQVMADCARRAIALDPDQGHARAMLGIWEFLNGNPVGALDLAYEAHRLDPNNIDIAVRLGSFLLYLGLPGEALPYIEAAIERDPVQGRTYAALTAAHMGLGQFDQAVAAGQRMEDLEFPAFLLAVALAANGEHQRAVDTYYGLRRHFETMVMRPAGMPPISDAARDAYFSLGARGICSGDPEARATYCALLDSLHRTMADPYDTSIALPAVWTGHAELVMKIYREQTSLANLFGLLTLWVDVDPIRRTREHPDFLQFCRDAGYVSAWDKYGWPSVMKSTAKTRD